MIVLAVPVLGLIACAAFVTNAFLSAALWAGAAGCLLAIVAINTSLDFVFRTVLYMHALGYDVSRSGWSDEALQLAFKPK